MKRSAFLLVVIIVSLARSSAFATPVSIAFSFHDDNFGSDITGIIEGLDDNGSGQAATSVVVTSNSAGYGTGEYVGVPNINIWDLVNGVITSVYFISFGINNTAPDVVCCSLVITNDLLPNEPVAGGLQDTVDTLDYNGSSLVTFTIRNSTVPLPQTILLLIAGLACLGVHRRIDTWRRRTCHWRISGA
jgi:hypothetical protein